MTINQTAKKLSVSFYEYVFNREYKAGNIKDTHVS